MTNPAPVDVERKRAPLEYAVFLLTADHRGGFSNGDLAELRRLSPEDAGSPAMWKVLSEVHDRDLSGPELEHALPAWACALQAVAQLAGAGGPRGRKLGPALAAAEFSELRLLRLLRADPPNLYREIRTAAQFLAQKGVDVNPLELGKLALEAHRDGMERLRRSIAHGYYRELHKKSQSSHPATSKES